MSVAGSDLETPYAQQRVLHHIRRLKQSLLYREGDAYCLMFIFPCFLFLFISRPFLTHAKKRKTNLQHVTHNTNSRDAVIQTPLFPHFR